jgi:hypothetical protein
MQKPERSVYNAQDFLQWREAGVLELTPKFQRRGVWAQAARSFFIDTLLRGMPAPPIYIRIVQGKDSKGIVRQVVDGQQRVSAVLGFIDGDFRLSRSLKGEWGGKTFDKLSKEEQTRIGAYSFAAEVFQGVSDLEVLEIFARLNTYSVALNAQELRNGKYFGVFKQTAYALALEHLEFWRRHGVFTERNIARMLEVELTSELMIALTEGMQDKKKGVDGFYSKWDDAYPARAQTKKRVLDVIDSINEAFPDSLKQTEFHRPPLFFSLFTCLAHRAFKLPNERMKSPRRSLTKNERVSLRGAVEKLSEIVARGRDHEAIPPKYSGFVAACLRQTDNIKPRQERLKILYSEAFGE